MSFCSKADFVISYAILHFRELILAYTAKRANPFFRYIFPSSACSNTVIGITNLRIIHITTNVTYPFCH